MCLAVYLASSLPLRAVAWDKAAPAFYLEPLAEGESVRKQFSLAYVYYVGTHKGCGCGFSKDGEVGEELKACQENYVALSRTIREAISVGARAELFTCWEGAQRAAPAFRGSATPFELQTPSFELKELQLLQVIENDA